MEKEIWVTAYGKKGYEVSNQGRVRSIDREIVFYQKNQYQKVATRKVKKLRGFLVKLSVSTPGYYSYIFSTGGKAKDRRPTIIHRIIWESFNGKIPNKMTIDHLDGNKLNNNLSNLSVCTLGENVKRMWDRKIKNNVVHHNTKYFLSKEEILEIYNFERKVGNGILLAKRFSVPRSFIYTVWAGGRINKRTDRI